MPFRETQPDPGFTSYFNAPPEEQAASGQGLSPASIIHTMASAARAAMPTLFPGGAAQTVAEAKPVVSAAFDLDNDVANWIQLATRPTFTPDRDFNVVNQLKTDGLWDEYRDNFLGVESRAEYNFRKEQIMRHEAEQRTLASAGLGGMLASIAAGAASPTMLLPFIGDARGAAAVGRGLAMGLVASGLQEAPLRINQFDRSWADTAESVGVGTLLGGVLGGAAGFLRGPEREAIEKGLEGRMAGIPGNSAIPEPASAGAAARDRVVPGGLAPATPGLRLGEHDVTLPQEGVLGLDAADRGAIAGLDPVMRTLSQQDFAEGRWIMAQLSDGGVETDASQAARVASEGGTAENNISSRWGLLATFAHKLDEAYSDYVFSGEPKRLANLRATVAGMRPGRSFMSKSEFRAAVTWALFQGDESVVPQVKELAGWARSHILDPLFQEGLQEKVFVNPEQDLKGDVSYMHRSYDTRAIELRQAEFEQLLSEHIDGVLQADFQKRLAAFQKKNIRQQEQIEDYGRSPEEVAALKEEFQNDLRALDEATRGTDIEEAELAASDAREAAREARLEGDEDRRVEALQAAREAEARGGRPLANLKQMRAHLRRRINNLNKSSAAVSARQAAKLDRITQIEDQNLASLHRLVSKAQRLLDRMDKLDDKELDEEISRLRTAFAEAGARFDRGEDRIAKLEENEFFGPQEGTEPGAALADEQARQFQRNKRLNYYSDALEAAENMDRDEARGVIQEALDAAVSDTNELVSRRAVRAAKLADEAAKLDPALVEAKIAEIKRDLTVRAVRFNERTREAGADSFDPETGQADFKNYAADMANSITNKILGTYRRLPGYDLLMGPRGAELARFLSIPSTKLVSHDGTPFIKTNVEEVLHDYMSTLVPDIEIHKRLGEFALDKMKNESFVRLRREYEAKQEVLETRLRGQGKTDEQIAKAKDKLLKRYNRVVEDLDGVIDRLRHQRGIPTNPAGFAARAGRVILNLNTATKMGGVVIASLPDPGRPIMKYGLLHTFREAWVPLLRSLADLDAQRFVKSEIHLAGVSIENVNHARAHDLWGVNDFNVRGSKFEKALDYATSKIGAIALFDHWTNVMKQITALAANAMTMNALRDVMENGGGKLASRQFLARAGIDDGLAREIWLEINREGGSNEVAGQLWPNTEAWQNVRAVKAYRQLLLKEANDTIITPGASRPLMMDAGLLNRILFQFKNFGMASMSKTIVAGLQKRDLGVLNGVLISLAMGALSYYLYAKTAGGKIETQMQNELASGNWERFADEAINRSGLLGAFTNVQDILSDIPLTAPYVTLAGHQTARRNESNLIESLFGPTADMVNNLRIVAQDSARDAAGDPKALARDVHLLRKSFLPFQNLFLIRRALDQVIP